MPSRENIDDIVSKEALAQIDTLIANLKVTEESMTRLIQKTLEFNAAVGSSSALKEFNTNSKKAKEVTDELNTETKAFMQNFKQYEALSVRMAAAKSAEGLELAKYREQLKATEKATRDAAKAATTQLDAYQKLEQQYKEAAQAAKALAAADDKNAKAAAQHAYELNARLKAIDKSVGDNRRNVGNYAESFREALGTAIPALGSIQNSIVGVTGAANGLTAAGGGWLILINILVQVIGYLRNFDPIMDQLEGAFSAYGAVLNNVSKDLIYFFTNLDKIGEFFKGFGNLMIHPIDSIKEWANELNRAASAAYDLTQAQDDLEDAMVDQEVATARAQQKISQLILEARNKELSPAERKKKLDEAAKIDQQDFDRRTLQARARLQITLKDAEQYGELNGEYVDDLKKRGTAAATELFKIGRIEKRHRDAIHDAEIEIVNILKESTDRQTKIQNRRDQADDEATRNAEQRAREREAAARKRKEAEERAFEELKKRLAIEERLVSKTATAFQGLSEEQTKNALDLLGKGAAVLRDGALQSTKDSSKIALNFTAGYNAIKKARQNVADDQEKSRKEYSEKTIKDLQAIQDYGSKTMDILGDALQISIDKRKNAIQDEINALEDRTAAEIDAVNASVDSEEKKAAKIALIQAKSQSEKEKLERKQKELDREKAINDKAKAIFDIIIQTAVAVASAKTIFEGIARAAIGAAQLAIVAATPIPKFATGTEHAPEGPAIVGEQGEELMITPEGKLIRTPSKPTLVYLSEGTRVIPHNKLKDMALQGLAISATGITSGGATIDLSKVTEATISGAQQITKAIKNQRTLTRDGLFADFKYNQRLIEYYKKNLR